jgi:hypothetical protein
MKSTYDVVAIVVVRRFEADNKCWPSLKKMALQTDLSNLRLHPAPHHAIEIEQPARSDMEKDPADEPASALREDGTMARTRAR